jgi:hypothetical protein
MPMRLTGKPSLAYKGVEAPQPPNIVESKGAIARSPTTSDYYEYSEGDLWMVKRAAGAPIPEELWYLSRKTGTALGVEADWRQLYPQAGAGGGGNLRSEDLNISVPDAFGAINVWGGNVHPGGVLSDPSNSNIFTLQDPNVNTLKIMLKRTIMQPNTNITASEGMYQLGGLNFMHNYGTHNTWIGNSAGNLALIVANATDNTGIGDGSLMNISSGQVNTACGSGALDSTTSGSFNIGLGALAGDLLQGADSSNILIGNNVGVAADNNTIRIGAMGVGAGQQNQAFMAGIWNGPAVPGANTAIVIVDNAGQLYADDVPPNCILGTNAGGNCIGLKGPVGTVLTGHGIAVGDPAPEFLPIESAGGTVVIATNPITGAINLEAAGVAGLVQLTSDTGVALPLVGNINVFGGELINTDNLVANTVTVNLDRGLNTQVVAGTGAGTAAEYKTLQSHDGTVVFDFATPGVIDMIAVLGGGGALTNLLADIVLAPATPVMGAVTVRGGLNIQTVCDIGYVEVNVTDDVDLAGHLYAQGDVKTVLGDLWSAAGNLKLPVTTAPFGITQGAIFLGADKFIHSFGINNVFIGKRSGNLTLNTVSAQNNTATGLASLESLTNGYNNTTGGFDSSSKITTGNVNTAYGSTALNKLTTGSFNACFGWNAGANYVGAEQSNICIANTGVAGEGHIMRIGTSGFGDAQVSDTYVAGIYGRAAGPVPMMVTCGNNGKLATAAIPGGGILFLGADVGGPAVPVGGLINIDGGYNIGTRAAGNTVTIDVDGSIQQNNTTAAGDGIYALGVRGDATYTANRFMHNYGTSCTWLGYQAGPIALPGASNCVGIGTNALDSATGMQSSIGVGRNALTQATSSSYCTALGAYSGEGVTTGQRNVMVGYKAGMNYTTESYNIILGGLYTAPEASTAGDTKTMRLGYKETWSVVVDPHNPDGVFTINQTGTHDTYIYGIYNRPLDSSALPVYCDKNGKVGTSGNVMFAYRQTADLLNVTGDASVYSFGTSGGITVDFDNTNSLSYAGAVGASNFIFTAPYAGKYLFTGTIVVSVPASPPVPRVVSRDPLWLVTSQLDYCFSSYIPASTTTAQYISEIVTAIVYLDTGDTARFACAVGAVTDVKNISVRATLTAPIVPVGAATAIGTHFYGYRIG